MIYVPDTHAIVWFLEGNPKLLPAADGALQDPAANFVVPTMVLVEIQFLYAKQRTNIDLETVYRELLNTPSFAVHSLDEEIVALIPTDLNIHDSIIVATALYYRDIRQESTALITKDGAITSSGLIQTLW